MPLSNAMYARVPERRSPNRRTLPAPHACGVSIAKADPSIDALSSAPVMATSVCCSNRNSGPSTVASSTAESAGLPTSAFASRYARRSIGPETGTPRSWYPQRPLLSAVGLVDPSPPNRLQPIRAVSHLPGHPGEFLLGVPGEMFHGLLVRSRAPAVLGEERRETLNFTMVTLTLVVVIVTTGLVSYPISRLLRQVIGLEGT